MKKKILLLPLLLMAVAVSAEPIVRVVSAGGSSKAFATDEVRKLVLSADQVDVVNNAGSVLLTVPKADIARVEFAEGTPDTPGSVEQVPSDPIQCTKLIHNGQLYLLYKGTLYDVQGRIIKRKN
ncbi:MAG: hypothetical protein IJQ20_10220 [Paludibacteraceae bacterium]|nr:hypothetical protein [Paludibacteraceae bacterium]MBQ6985282.1 hypothetical protein [Paludibacteraceae bacterium]